MRSGIIATLLLQLFHHTLNQLLRVSQALHDDLDVHHRLARPALALAVDTVLTHQRHSVGDRVHGDGEPPAGHAHHRLVVLQLFLLLIEYRHRAIVTAGAREHNSYVLLTFSSLTRQNPLMPQTIKGETMPKQLALFTCVIFALTLLASAQGNRPPPPPLHHAISAAPRPSKPTTPARAY